MLDAYFPILVFMVVGIVCACVPMLLGALLGPRRANAEKSAPYECGFEPFTNARIKFDVRFYLVAILFIIFDLEIVFLFPFAVAIDKMDWIAFAGVGLFLAFLVVGFIYEWKKGALEWE
jgi:NADH-quinone oxidoreductase subunit A